MPAKKKKKRLKVKTMERRPEHDKKKPDLLKRGARAVKQQGKQPRKSGSRATRKMMRDVDI